MQIGSTDSLDIRPASAADAARIAQLFVQLGYDAVADDVERRLQRTDGVTLVAANGGQVLGVLVMHLIAPLHVARPWAVISSLVVDEAARSNGAGAALIAHAQELAMARDCAHIELSCSERRTQAHAFYAAQGFEEVRKRLVKRLPNGYSTNQAFHRMDSE